MVTKSFPVFRNICKSLRILGFQHGVLEIWHFHLKAYYSQLKMLVFCSLHSSKSKIFDVLIFSILFVF
uniref:Uncharacterized protein n=1 Tax=Octopus bimaculoides TaxID=37653 RepID=A0A0L8GW21_OCTBM